MVRTKAWLVALALAATGSITAAPAATAAPNEYVTMSDGVQIAVSVRVPEHCTDKNCPAIFEMSGYDGGSAQDGTMSKDISEATGIPGLPLRGDSSSLTHHLRDSYVVVHASARGTGCSGGEFDLFGWRTALDGKEVIDGWIPDQPWSDGRVAIIGHSYGGITGFMVTATQPRRLVAASLSGLVDDLYRGLVYMGGVSNYGFPLLWTAGVRPAYDVGGGILPGLARPPADDPDGVRRGCATNASTKSRTVFDEPVLQGSQDTDGEWWRARALASYAHRIAVPTHIVGAYQDEQTGPRGPARLWEMIDGVPKRLLLTNGDHGTAGFYAGDSTYTSAPVAADRRAWLDHFVFGDTDGYDDTSVEVYFETRGGQPNFTRRSPTFPLQDTTWTDRYLDGESLSDVPGGDSSASYVSGSPRQSWSYQAGYGSGPPFTTASGPDELTFRSEEMDSAVAIAGPITATLHLSSTSPEPEVFVQLVDEGDDGSYTYLQRGMLRLSHRSVDVLHSDCVDAGNVRVHCADDGAHMYRPHRPHTNPTLVTPGEVGEYLVELFPVGHVFRPGHRIVVKIHTPPLVDSYYLYVPRRAPGITTVHMGAGHPSRITLPVVGLDGVDIGEPRGCGQQEAVRCVARPNG